MTAKVITFGISKGGCSKTMSAGITAFLLSEEVRVLCVDMDSQGNLTSLMLNEDDLCGVFEGKTVLEGIKEGDVSPYIVNARHNLDVVPANDYLSLLPRFLYKEYKGDPNLALKRALEPVLEDYDIILLDTPPSLSELSVCSITASSEIVVLFDGSKFCYHAIDRYLEICAAAREHGNPDLNIAGILFSIVDPRTSDTRAMVDLVDSAYPNYRFDTLINRKVATKRLAIYGFGDDNPELDTAIEGYRPFVKELKERVK